MTLNNERKLGTYVPSAFLFGQQFRPGGTFSNQVGTSLCGGHNLPSLVGIGLKFIYSEKATKFCEIFPYLLTVCTVVKS